MQKQIRIRFYEELNEFLLPRVRRKTFEHKVNGNTTIKDVIESLGVPHTEIDLILANGESVDFTYVPENGDRISVYPVFESLDISEVTHLRPEPLRNTKFILDVHLGKLARKLRMIGFDTLYRNDFDDDEIIKIGLEEKRIILTRDVGILKNKSVTHGYFVKSQQPAKQLEEVIGRFDLRSQIRPLSRCIECNGKIIPVGKDEIIHRLQPRTREHFNEFFQCTGCGKIYWEGSHYDKIVAKINALLEKSF